MKNLIQKLFRKSTKVNDGFKINSSNSINYKALNRYLLQISQQESIEEMVSETSKYLKDILNYQHFALAITEKNNRMIWSDPVLNKTTVKEIIEKDFSHPELFKIHYINNNDKVINTAFSKPEPLKSYDFSCDQLRLKLYMKYTDHNSQVESETANIITRALGNTLVKMLKIKKLETEASTDHLTECYNRRSFTNILKHNIENSHRYNRDLSLILMDIDYFKKINDTYGHQTGDEVLKAVSKATQSIIRKGDYLARYGGEEFAVVLPETTHSMAIETACRLKADIENLLINTSDNKMIRVTSSFGVSTLKAEDNMDSLLAEADSMLYKAKESGRNCVMPAASFIAEEPPLAAAN